MRTLCQCDSVFLVTLTLTLLPISHARCEVRPDLWVDMEDERSLVVVKNESELDDLVRCSLSLSPPKPPLFTLPFGADCRPF
jgi:hypothetical protein